MVLLLFLMLVMLIVEYWHLVVGALVLYLVWRWGVEPWQQARAREAHDRLRHEHARKEIDAIALVTTRAMFEATQNSDAVDGRAVERRRP
jgi:uncharacterized membrane protein YdjX (TVP38/TMEM64 family)